MTQVRKTSARAIVRLVIAVCLLGMMPALTAHPKSAKAATEYVVGDPGPAGGIVFYVATTPFKCGADLTADCTYLEAAPNGWNSGSDPGLSWGGGAGALGTCSNKTIPGASGTSIGSGFANTAAIMIACPDVSGNKSAPAARAASSYAPSGEAGGWFLPSRDELTKLCEYSGQKSLASVVFPMQSGSCYSGGNLYSGFRATGYYWSSSQSAKTYAYSRIFIGDVQQENRTFQNEGRWVRPVRAF